MKKYIHLPVIFASVLFAFSAQEVFSEQMPLNQFVGKAVDKCGVFFTFEGAYSGNSIDETLLGENISFQQFPADIDSAIFAITNSITNLMVMPDATNNKIYHIIDKRLLGMDGYAMNQVLASNKFDGNGEDFVNHIKENVPNLENNNLFSGAIIILNQGTVVSIDDKNVSVRDALSNGIDFSRDKPFYGFIWTSFTSLETRQTPVAFQCIARSIGH